jgi:hypothetical protein
MAKDRMMCLFTLYADKNPLISLGKLYKGFSLCVGLTRLIKNKKTKGEQGAIKTACSP